MGLRTTRRAARFARAVDAGCPDAADPDTRELVVLAARLHETGSQDGPTPEFRDRLGQRLLAVATVQLPVQAEHAARHGTTRVVVPRSSKSGPRLAFVAAMLCALVGLSGVAIVASSRALPGDALYALKRTTEDMSIALAPGEESRGWRLLDAARTRAHEVRDIVERDFTGDSTGDTDLVVGTMDDMDSRTLEGASVLVTHAVTELVDPPLADLAAWAADQRALLDPVVERLPGEAADRARDSLGLLDQVRDRVEILRSQLSCGCLNPDRRDRLGPLPCEDCGQASEPTDPGTGTAPPPGSSPAPSSGTEPTDPTQSSGTAPPSSGSSSPPDSDGPLPTLPNLPTVPSEGGLPPLVPTGLPPLLPGE